MTACTNDKVAGKEQCIILLPNSRFRHTNVYHLISLCFFEDLCELSKSVLECDGMGSSWPSGTLRVTAETGMCQ